MKIKLIIITLLVILTHSLSIAQERHNVRGLILSRQDSLPVSFIDISIGELNTGVVSDILGVFKISVLPDDTLVISGVGYNRKIIPAADLISDNISNTIYVSPAVYILDQVDVNNDGIKLNIRGIGERNDTPMEVRSRGLGDDASVLSYIASPAAALNSLGKKERERKEARAVLASIGTWEDFYSKATISRVKRITGASDEEADKFMLYFNANHQLQPTASLMQVSERIDYLWKTFVEKETEKKLKESAKQDTLYVSPKEYRRLMRERKKKKN